MKRKISKKKGRVTNAAAGGKKIRQKKKKKGAGGVKKRGDNWNNVTLSSKKWLKFYPQCNHYCTQPVLQ